MLSVIADISISENKSLIERLKKEDPNMSKAVFEIFKDEIEADKNAAVNESVNEAVSNNSEDIANT